MDSLSNLRNSLDDSDYSSLRSDGTDGAGSDATTDIASLEKRRRQKHLGDHEQELTKQFKAAALQLTTLYRSSLTSNKASYEAGYRHALSHVLELLLRSPTPQPSVVTTASSEASSSAIYDDRLQQTDGSALGNLTPEQSMQRLRWLSGYLQRRIEAMSTQDDDDDAAPAPSPSSATAAPPSGSERARTERFEGLYGAQHLRQHLARSSSSPLRSAATSLPSPLAAAVHFSDSALGSTSSSTLRSGLNTPAMAGTPPPGTASDPSVARHPDGSTPSTGRATECGSKSGKAKQESGQTAQSASSFHPPGSSSAGGTGTKRNRGESSGGMASGSSGVGSGGDTFRFTSTARDPATPHRRRISGRKNLSSNYLASSVVGYPPSACAIPGGGTPEAASAPMGLRASSFDFRLPQALGVKNVDFSDHGVAAAAAVTAAKLNAGKKQGAAGTTAAAAAAGSAAARRIGSNSGIRRSRSGMRLRAPAGGLRAGTIGAPSSSTGVNDMVTDSEDDWTDDDNGHDDDEGAISAVAAAGSGGPSSRHGPHPRGGRAKRRRTARAQEPNNDSARDGTDGRGAASDVDM